MSLKSLIHAPNTVQYSIGSGNDSSYTSKMYYLLSILANPGMETYAPNTCQQRDMPQGNINQNRYPVFLNTSNHGHLCKQQSIPSKQKIFISYSVYLIYMFWENILEKILM